MIYKARGYDDCTMHYIGNGRMLVCGDGADLWSIQGSHSSACFGALRVCTENESETERVQGSLCYKHSLYLGRALLDAVEERWEMPQISLCDFVHPERDIFIRHSRSYHSYKMQLSIPPYVRRFKYENYKFDLCLTVYCYVIPANTCYFEHFTCPKEMRMFVAAIGDVAFDGECFEVGEGSSQIIITTGDPFAVTDNMRYALRYSRQELQDSPIYRRAVHNWNMTFSKCPDSRSENIIASLLARQSVSGGITSSHALPMADIKVFPYAVKAFKALGMEDEAKRLIAFLYGKLDALGSKKVHTYYGIEGSDVIEDINQGLSAAYALYAFMLWFENKKPDASHQQLMKGLFYTAMHSVVQGTVPFSKNESELEVGIISYDMMFQGSAAASALVLSACRDFLDFARFHKIRMRDDARTADALISKGLKDFDATFVSGGVPVVNSLKTEGSTKRVRYVMAKCPVCERQGRYSPITWLEKDKFGRYSCPGCFSGKSVPDSYSVEKYTVISHLCICLLLGAYTGNALEKGLEIIKERAELYVNKCRDIPLRPSAEDILVSSALKKYGIDNTEYNEKLDDLSNSAGMFARYLSGEKHVGSQGDAYTAVLYLCNLLDR